MLIFLIGYMACGKSTIGRRLSKKLEWELHDTDKEIVADEALTVAEIFDTHGEEYFRQKESAKIKSLITSGISAVISTGGGAPVWGDNMKIMSEAGVVIYLYRSAENIAGRLSAFGREKRPKLRGLSDDELLGFLKQGIAERDPLYRRAGKVIDCDELSDDAIVDMIIDYAVTTENK